MKEIKVKCNSQFPGDTGTPGWHRSNQGSRPPSSQRLRRSGCGHLQRRTDRRGTTLRRENILTYLNCAMTCQGQQGALMSRSQKNKVSCYSYVHRKWPYKSTSSFIRWMKEMKQVLHLFVSFFAHTHIPHITCRGSCLCCLALSQDCRLIFDFRKEGVGTGCWRHSGWIWTAVWAI